MGDWNPQDSIRFTTMLSTSIIATLICYAPFYVVTILAIELFELKKILIIFSTIFITLFSIYFISIYKKSTLKVLSSKIDFKLTPKPFQQHPPQPSPFIEKSPKFW